MDDISVDYIQSCLDNLAGQVNKHIQHQLLKFDENLKELQQWKLLAIEQLENSSASSNVVGKVKKITRPVKFKVGRGASFPNKGKFKGKRKLEFLKACSNHLKEIKSKILEESLEVDKVVRQTRSLSTIMSNNIQTCSRGELLTMHSDLTRKCNEFLLPSSKNPPKDVLKFKDSEELLELHGVNSKTFVERSLNHTRFPSLKMCDVDECHKILPDVVTNDFVIDSQDIPPHNFKPDATKETTYLSNDKIDIVNPESNKVFEVGEKINDEVNDMVFPSEKNLLPQGTNVAKLKLIKTVRSCINENRTPVGKHMLNGSNDKFSTPASSSNSRLPIIKKKNVTSYLQLKSMVSNSKGAILPAASTSRKKDCVKQPILSASKSASSNTRPLRNLRTRLPPAETKTTAKTTTKRTRVKDSPEVKNKRKLREENAKQQKLDLQLKKDEKKQQREERMQKTKEMREKLEQERLNKLQGSVEKKRANMNKGLEPVKKMRVTRQTKQQSGKPGTPTLKVTKQKKKSAPANAKSKKLKKPSLVTVNEVEMQPEVETKPEIISSVPSHKSSTFVIDKDSSSISEEKPFQSGNSTFTVKISPVQEPKAIVEEHKCLPSNTYVSETPEQAISNGASNATYVASKTPEVSVKQDSPATPFKVPNFTPKQNSKTALKNISGNSRISSEFNYEMTPYRDDDEDSLEEDEPKKPIPSWASGIRLKEAIIKQACYPPDLDKLFGKMALKVDLEAMFGSQRRKIYKKRTSSAVWRNISFNLDI